ncbi:uncharacterized protein LOC113234484 isoform X2 [Hyposmocoma kahamanoa]|nr:uncharacterized protein LOC113234484 isoform X2 [Hyposmocoma kahamanoa]XP_026325602.1 uncharacterized protein LOC113234484 isoform X2 [Hyposmocoma kahamanoa]XP_026325603.1 uncharacterized protein LOC113234484 isoform X2 [Hyposmocoma kahamanoa]
MTRERHTTEAGSRIGTLLTQFSQEYTTTASPERTNITTRRRKNCKKQKVVPAAPTHLSTHRFEPINNSGVNEKQKLKFKSKVLNDQVNKQYQPLIVIQAQKDMPKTPSNCSDAKELFENLKTLPFPKIDFKLEDIVHTKANDIIKTAQFNRSILQTLDEPNTLVGDNNKDILYDLFVKLLEISFKMYNVETDFKNEHARSNNVMEIDEQVATKLNVKKNLEKADAFSDLKTPEQYFNIIDEGIYTWNDHRVQVMEKQPLHKNLEPPLVNIPKRKKMFLRSFSHAPRNDILGHERSHVSSKYERTVTEQKPQKRRFKNFRNVLLDTLKEDLKMDKDDFEEPQNMHEALKIIAKNKRKCRTQVRLDKGVKFKKIGEDTNTDCQFKRKRVISTVTEARKHKKLTKNFVKIKTAIEPTNFICQKKCRAAPHLINTELDEYKPSEISDRPSIQSIEVKGFDFESNTIRQLRDLRSKDSLCSDATFHCLRQEDSSRYFLETAPTDATCVETNRANDNTHSTGNEVKTEVKLSTEVITDCLQFDTDSDGDDVSLGMETGSNCSSSFSVRNDSLSNLLTKDKVKFWKKFNKKKMKVENLKLKKKV